MSDDKIDNLHVVSQDPLMTPAQLMGKWPRTEKANRTIIEARKTIDHILSGEDHRIFVVVGPCSIHDIEAAKEYALRLKTLAADLSDTLYLVMRVYFEKPRTTVGWKGLINDPELDGSYNITEGLNRARGLLIHLAELGVPTSSEALDPFSPQYLADLISWYAIGARTTESQTHREMASGLSAAVGFKNGTQGDLTVATNALKSVSNPHRFLGINKEGLASIIRTSGNPSAHIVLRGGSHGPNYSVEHIKKCEAHLESADCLQNIMVDCSHANSDKNPENQPMVLKDLSAQIKAGNRSICGVMLESHIHAGNQSIPRDLSELRYGVSVTDGCIDWETTEQCLRALRHELKGTLPGRRKDLHSVSVS